jgi:hypothetical protein
MGTTFNPAILGHHLVTGCPIPRDLARAWRVPGVTPSHPVPTFSVRGFVYSQHMLRCSAFFHEVHNRLELVLREITGQRPPRFRPPAHDRVRDAAVCLVAVGATLHVRARGELHAVATAVLVAARDPSVVARVAHLGATLTQAPGVVRSALRTTPATHSSAFRHARSIYTGAAVVKRRNWEISVIFTVEFRHVAGVQCAEKPHSAATIRVMGFTFA